MKPTGLILIAVLLAAPLIWMPGIAQGRDVIALFSQYIGLAALIAMAISHLIATRWAGVEAIFGPLDQSYRIHKWLGIGSMVAILVHDTIDADMRGLGQETVLTEVAETAGEVSLYGLLILVVITIATFIPYHLWKWTHRLIGIFFVAGAFHYLAILKPWANFDPLGLYMLVICGVGTLAYLWTSAPRGMRPARTYQITDVTPQGRGVAVDMAPQGRPLKHRPGQFAFFGFHGAGLPEPHPFTISSAPRADGSLRVTIAPLGDLTARVARSLKAGQAVHIDGPYGHFGRSMAKRAIWVAGGIGVTPFVALAEDLATDGPEVTLILAVPNRDQAAHLETLEALAKDKPNLTLKLWESECQGRLTADDVARLGGGDLSETHVLFCGPVPMRKALAQGLTRHGVTARRFHYEAFEIRTGIGLNSFARWLWARRDRLARTGG